MDQRFGANSKNVFFRKILLQIFCFFKAFLPLKMLKMTLSTRVQSVQHPNAGQNIQHKSSNSGKPGLGSQTAFASNHQNLEQKATINLNFRLLTFLSSRHSSTVSTRHLQLLRSQVQILARERI